MQNLNSKLLYIWNKTIVFSTSCAKCGSIKDRIFNGDQSIEMLRILDLINNTND